MLLSLAWRVGVREPCDLVSPVSTFRLVKVGLQSSSHLIRLSWYHLGENNASVGGRYRAPSVLLHRGHELAAARGVLLELKQLMLRVLESPSAVSDMSARTVAFTSFSQLK